MLLGFIFSSSILRVTTEFFVFLLCPQVNYHVPTSVLGFTGPSLIRQWLEEEEEDVKGSYGLGYRIALKTDHSFNMRAEVDRPYTSWRNVFLLCGLWRNYNSLSKANLKGFRNCEQIKRFSENSVPGVTWVSVEWRLGPGTSRLIAGIRISVPPTLQRATDAGSNTVHALVEELTAAWVWQEYGVRGRGALGFRLSACRGTAFRVSCEKFWAATAARIIATA